MTSVTELDRDKRVVDSASYGYFGKPANEVTELEAIETMYPEKDWSPEMRARVEFLRPKEASKQAAAYIARVKKIGIPAPEELVRVVAYCDEFLKREERLAKEFDRPGRKKQKRLLSVEEKSLLLIVGLITQSDPYNFDPNRRTKAVGQICELARQRGVILDQQTVLDWLREAAKELAGARDRKIGP